MKFREAQLKDLERLYKIEQEVIEAERAYNPSIKLEKTCYYDIEKLMSDSRTYLIVAEDDASIIGTGYAQLQSSKKSLQHDLHAYLGFMYVSPLYRGKGINKQVIENLISWSRAQGAKDYYLDVYSGNASAIRAYEKFGFTPSLVEMKLSS
ncbi:MAG: GNAT superfamily N-acetyltransferase [Flavobacterium sp.]